MAAGLTTRASNILRNALFQKYRQSLVGSAIRCLVSEAKSDQEEFKFEALTGDLAGKFT